jgi:hypothetical protein
MTKTIEEFTKDLILKDLDSIRIKDNSQWVSGPMILTHSEHVILAEALAYLIRNLVVVPDSSKSQGDKP